MVYWIFFIRKNNTDTICDDRGVIPMKKAKKDPVLLRTVNSILDSYDPQQKELFGEMFYQAIKQAAEIGATAGAEKAAAVIESEHRKFRSDRFDKQYANTRLLLRHYRSLNAHYSNAVWEKEEDTSDDFVDFMELMNSKGYSDAVVVDTIKKSAEKTRVIMQHVNKMLGIYKKQCEHSTYAEDLRHWRVIKALYLSPSRVTADTVAEREKINRRTVYKDVDAAVEVLTMLLFGIDGIEKLSE